MWTSSTFSYNTQKFTTSELSRFFADPNKVFARKIFAELEVRAGRARMVGVICDNNHNEDIYVLERI